MRPLLPLLALLAFAAGIAMIRPSQHPLTAQQAPQVPSKEQSQSAAESEANANQQASRLRQGETNIKDSYSPNSQGKGDYNANQGADETTEYWAILGRRLKITDTLLAIFTFALIIVGWWQGNQLKRTVDHMEGASERQLRAYVHIKLTERTTVWPILHVVPSTGFEVINAGQTPAYDLIYDSNIAVASYPDPTLPPPKKDEIGSRMPMHPRQKAQGEAHATAPLSVQDFERLKSPAFRIYVYGAITYQDAFGRTRETCFRLVSQSHGIQQHWFQFCPEGNEAT